MTERAAGSSNGDDGNTSVHPGNSSGIKVLLEHPVYEETGTGGNQQRYVIRLIRFTDTSALSVGISRQWLKGDNDGEWLPGKRGGHLYMPMRVWQSLAGCIHDVNQEIQSRITSAANTADGEQQQQGEPQQQQKQQQQQQWHYGNGERGGRNLSRDVSTAANVATGNTDFTSSINFGERGHGECAQKRRSIGGIDIATSTLFKKPPPYCLPTYSPRDTTSTAHDDDISSSSNSNDGGNSGNSGSTGTPAKTLKPTEQCDATGLGRRSCVYNSDNATSVQRRRDGSS